MSWCRNPWHFLPLKKSTGVFSYIFIITLKMFALFWNDNIREPAICKHLFANNIFCLCTVIILEELNWYVFFPFGIWYCMYMGVIVPLVNWLLKYQRYFYVLYKNLDPDSRSFWRSTWGGFAESPTQHILLDLYFSDQVSHAAGTQSSWGFSCWCFRVVICKFIFIHSIHLKARVQASKFGLWYFQMSI